MDDEELPTVEHTAEMQIGPVTLVVHNLSDGRRVIEEQSMIAFFAALEAGELSMTPDEARKVAKVLG